MRWCVLIDQRIVALIKEYCEEIGLDPAWFAAHSTRSGYVTSSSGRGVPISEMMKRTRHRAVSSLQVYEERRVVPERRRPTLVGSCGGDAERMLSDRKTTLVVFLQHEES